MRWLRGRTRDIADQVDVPSAQPARHWLNDRREHQRALSALTRGEMYAYSILDDGVYYVISARPSNSPTGEAAPW